jgi:outer membrane biosynthesis protein TonB
VSVRARTALLVLVALLGLGGACAVGASPALAAATGGPDPDPPPPAPPAPVPPPPPAPVPPPPPPPAYVPPPPPAAAFTPRSKPKPKLHHAKPKAERKASRSAGSSTSLPRSPDKPLVASAAPVPATAATVTATSRHFLQLLLGVLLVISVIFVALAATPPWLLPRRVFLATYAHREAVITGGTTIAISIAIGLVVALLGS